MIANGDEQSRLVGIKEGRIRSLSTHGGVDYARQADVIDREGLSIMGRDVETG